jgi:hypothetical protein
LSRNEESAVILGEPNGKSVNTGIGGRATLDDLFRRAVERRPDAVALIDPPDRERFTDFPPRSLTYAQADRVISAIAGRLRWIGVRSDAIIGLQLGNSVESVLTFLAVLRAGMIAMPLPLLWRRADITNALSRAGASALIVSGRVGAHDQLDDAMQAAVETFHIRFVCGFGTTCSPSKRPIRFRCPRTGLIRRARPHISPSSPGMSAPMVRSRSRAATPNWRRGASPCCSRAGSSRTRRSSPR